jgi:hypothetical protein
MTENEAKLKQCDNDIAILEEERAHLIQLVEDEKRPKVRHGDILRYAGPPSGRKKPIRIAVNETGTLHTVCDDGTIGADGVMEIEDLITAGDYKNLGNIFDLSASELYWVFARHKAGAL